MDNDSSKAINLIRDNIPPELAGLKQFCLRKGKRPFIRDLSNGGFTPAWTDPAGWMDLAEALTELEKNHGYDGIGYLNARAPGPSEQHTGGDADACRDPRTGWISPWATEFMEQTRPFYCEVSPSGCGLRYFYRAKLPGRVNSLFGNGPQNIPDEVKEHIIAANPKVKEKIDKGEPAFNGLELYEDKRHLTITGNKLEEFCYPIEDRTEALAAALELAGISAPEKSKPNLSAADIEQIRRNMKRQGLTDKQIAAALTKMGINPAAAEKDSQGCGGNPGGEMPGWAGDMEKEARAGRLPHINILDVIDTRGWEQTGDQLRGPHPILGSSTGHNLVVNPGENIWAYMHCNINSGGDAWTWLACECGAVPWEQAGAGALKDPAILQRTKEYAAARGLIKMDESEHFTPNDLEKALLHVAGCCDGAVSSDGKGFNRDDSVFGKAMAEKVQSGQHLSAQEYKDVYKMLKTYNKNQLVPAGMDIRNIPKEPPKEAKSEPKPEPVSPEIIRSAEDIIKNGSPIEAHLEYVKRKVYGREKEARAILLAAYSTFLSDDDRLHIDAVGSAQSGKSATVTAVLETFPEENVMVTSEASPKSLYYLAQSNPERLHDAIIYIDDARQDHIPVLKTFRNEGNVTPRNLTVVDGEVLELLVPYRPAVFASSVTPLRDLEQQATSRAFLVPFSDPSAEEEKKVRQAIRGKARFGAILARKDDDQLKVLRSLTRILRDKGVRSVVIPFDAEEPPSADRRGAGQFQRLIKISAFINQYHRPILVLKDGRKFVLAIYEDLEIAAKIWFDFIESQAFKISSKAIKVMEALPINELSGTTAPSIAKALGFGQRSAEVYLKDLYESGIASRAKLALPGSPWGYWVEPDIRNFILSQISDTGAFIGDSEGIAKKNLLRKYLGEKSSDSLIESIKELFSNSEVINKEMYKEIFFMGNHLDGESPGKIFFSYFSEKTLRKYENGATDSEHLRNAEISLFGEIPTDSDSKISQIGRNSALIKGETRPVRITARNGYRTQIPDPGNPMKFMDHIFSYAEVVDFAPDRAKDLVERGIAEYMEPGQITTNPGDPEPGGVEA